MWSIELQRSCFCTVIVWFRRAQPQDLNPRYFGPGSQVLPDTPDSQPRDAEESGIWVVSGFSKLLGAGDRVWGSGLGDSSCNLCLAFRSFNPKRKVLSGVWLSVVASTCSPEEQSHNLPPNPIATYESRIDDTSITLYENPIRALPYSLSEYLRSKRQPRPIRPR